jgi:predicted phage terminase large subunit-like protein
MPESERSVMDPVVRAELARRRLLDYGQLVLPYLHPASHVRMVCEHLEALERNDLKHLMILLPPRHSKTTLLSKLLPSWWVGRNARCEIILASNTARLAIDNSRAARDLVQSQEYPFTVRVREDVYAGELWRTTDGSVVRAVGLGGAIQGAGSNLLVVDDPIALAEETSDLSLERQWAWFGQDAARRLLPGGHIVIGMYRWADGDLAGRILEDPELRKDFTVLRLPIFAEADDPLGRAEDDILWPRSVGGDGRPCGFTHEEILFQKQIDSRSFSAQYELSPVSSEGNTFKDAWLQQRYSSIPKGGTVIQAIDGAWKTGVKNDWSVIATWAKENNRLFLVNVWRERVEFPGLKAAAIAQYREYNPSKILVEDAASGIGLIQSLKVETDLPIIGVPTRGAPKAARAEAVTPAFESGRVFLPDIRAPWLDAWIDEHLRFPNGNHDDMVDTTSLAIADLYQPGEFVYWEGVFQGLDIDGNPIGSSEIPEYQRAYPIRNIGFGNLEAVVAQALRDW